MGRPSVALVLSLAMLTFVSACGGREATLRPKTELSRTNTSTKSVQDVTKKMDLVKRTCTDSAVEKKYAYVQSLYERVMKTSMKSFSQFDTQINRIWDGVGVCDFVLHPALSDENAWKSIGVMYVGNALTVLVKFSEGEYAEARYHLEMFDAAYQTMKDALRLTGKRLPEWTPRDKTFFTIMYCAYDPALAELGYQPNHTPVPCAQVKK